VIDHVTTSQVWIAAFVRASAFAATVPIAGSGAVPRIVRGALALTLTPPVLTTLQNASGSPQWIEAVIVGAAFGTAAAMVASAASAAGSLVDSALAMRPFDHDGVFGGAQGPLGRVFSLAFAMLFLSTGTMTHLCSRFVEASSTIDHVISVRGAVALAKASLEVSLDIAAPALAAQVIATLASATAARAAPRINGLMLASPAAMVAVLVVVVAGTVQSFRALVALATLAASTSPR